MSQHPTPDPATSPATTSLAAALHTLVREEHVGCRPRRLLDPGHATWHRFGDRLGPRALAEFLLEDAALCQPEPFDIVTLLRSADALAVVPGVLVADPLTAIAALPLDAPARNYIDEQARRLELTARPTFSDVRKLQPQHRILELPDTGERLAGYVVQTQPGVFLKDVFTIAYGSWQERALAGIVAVEAGVGGEIRVALDSDHGAVAFSIERAVLPPAKEIPEGVWTDSTR